MGRVNSKVVGYVLPILTTVALVVLLTITLIRLADIQREMRNNTHANITWVVYQSHLESMMLGRVLEQTELNDELLPEVQFRYRMLLSRLQLLNEGLQLQALQSIDGYEEILAHTQALKSFKGLLDGSVDKEMVRRLIDELQSFDAMLSRIAGKTMAAQWEASGEQLDRYRNRVLLLLFLMAGVWVCSVFIVVQLLYALRKTREIEHAKRRELELSKRLEHERKISDLYRSFGEMVSHQFRNPLAVIDASMQRLVRAGSRMGGDEIARRAEKVRAATKRLTDLIDSILNADRFLEQVQARIRTYSLVDLAQQAIAEQRMLTPLRRIYLINEAGTEVLVRCDPVLTAQILENFLSNAVKYSDSNTEISVILRRKGEWVQCLVCDQGRGISNEDMEHIFKRYFRAWDASSVVGTGIGLHIASELASLQEGKVDVFSELGEGSIFVLSLQVADQVWKQKSDGGAQSEGL